MTDTSTLGRAAALRVAYASAMQDVQRLTEENARLKAERDTASASMQKAVNILHDADFDTAQHVQLSIGERDAARTRADAAEAEVGRLRAFVVEHGIAMDTPLGPTHRHICRDCGAMGNAPHVDPTDHAAGCIVAEAIAAHRTP